MGDYKKTSENVQATAVRFDSWQGVGWPVYERYEREEEGGDVFLVARRSPPRMKPERELRPEDQVGGVADVFRDRRLKVYSPPLDTPDLFIRFAKLGRQERITFEDVEYWVKEYGALGLAEVDVVEVVLPLSKVELVPPLKRKHERHKADHENGMDTVMRTDCGQGRRESFRGFCEAAWTMAETLSLLEALTGNELRTTALQRHGFQSGTPESISAAWSLVEQRVLSHVRRYCYPMSYRRTDKETGEISHTPGWGFDSLLGAMYLEFKHAMESRSEIRRCAAPDCSRIISVGGMEAVDYAGEERIRQRKVRSDRKYCDNGGACKQRAHDRKAAQQANGVDTSLTLTGPRKLKRAET